MNLSKIYTAKYLAGQEILSSNQRKIIEQVNFAYSPLEKSFEKQTKMIGKQGEKQIKSIENRVKKIFLDTNKKSMAFLLSKAFLNEEGTQELKKQQNQKMHSAEMI